MVIDQEKYKDYLISVRSSSVNLQYVPAEYQTIEMCASAARSNSWAFTYVINQTPEICLAAVKANHATIEFVKEQTIEMCLIAVKANAYLLDYVKNQTPEVCLAALKNNYRAIRYVKDLESIALHIPDDVIELALSIPNNGYIVDRLYKKVLTIKNRLRMANDTVNSMSIPETNKKTRVTL